MSEGPYIKERKVLWSGRYLQGMELTFMTSGGRELKWETCQRVGSEGIVAVVPFTDDGRVIMVKQFRPPVGRYVVEFPAGLNDRGESLEDVARRELLEETGYGEGSFVRLCEGPLSSGSMSDILTVFRADNVSLVGGQDLDPAEDIEVVLFPRDEFHEALLSFTDGKTLLDLKVPGLFELATRI